MAQQKSDDEFLNARIKKNQKNTLNKEEECKNEVDSLGERNLLVIDSGTAVNKYAQSLIQQEDIQPQNRFSYSCLAHVLKRNSDRKFDEIISAEIYTKDKNNEPGPVFLKNTEKLVGMLKWDGCLTLLMRGTSQISASNVGPKASFNFSGQHCSVTLRVQDEEAFYKIVNQEENFDTVMNFIEEHFEGTAGLDTVLEGLKKIELQSNFNNMTVCHALSQIVVPVLQILDCDKVMKNLGMERVKYGQPLNQGSENPIWYATYQKVGEPVKSDSVP